MSDVSELLKEAFQCIKCGLCMSSCPVGRLLMLEKYTPRGRIQLARHYFEGELKSSPHLRDIYFRCLLCGACSQVCPSGVDLKEILIQMRKEIALSEGLYPKIESAMESIMENYNVAGDENEERLEWAEEVDEFYIHDTVKSPDIVFFVGCVSSFFPMAQHIPVNIIKIFKKAGVSFMVLGDREWCCGFPLIGAGATKGLQNLINHNIDAVKSIGTKRVVFSCPSCLYTWRHYYKTDLELLHYTEFFLRLIKDGAISYSGMDMNLTYHDPCDLGRGCGIFNEPREILGSIEGVRLIELEKNRALSTCCGGGGNLEMIEPELTKEISSKKIDQIKRSGAGAVVTACQQCFRTIKTRVVRDKIDLKVMELSELLLKAIS